MIQEDQNNITGQWFSAGRRFLDTSISNPVRYPAGHVLGECPDNWVTFQNSCYLFAHTDHTFPDAQVLNVY